MVFTRTPRVRVSSFGLYYYRMMIGSKVFCVGEHGTIKVWRNGAFERMCRRLGV